MGLNRVELEGGLVRDPELRALPSGTFVCDFTLAVSGTKWDAEAHREVVDTSYFRCVLWFEQAEKFAETYHKGDQIYLVGQLTQDEVETREGKKERKTKVRVMWTRGLRRSTKPPAQAAEELPAPPF